MHLKRLHLKNFKSYEDSEIKFDLVNSIIGKNSAGKSNILRALKLILHHEDWPVGWIRYGQDSASVELELTDGTIVNRTRTRTSQVVSISKNGKTEVFEGKKDAAEFVQKALGVVKVTLDETTGPEDLNFIEVYDGPYLIGGRADTVQRKVAGIVGANKIDDARSRLLKQLKSQENKLSDILESLNRLNPIITQDRSFLESCQETLDSIKDAYNQWEQYQSKIQILNEFCEHFSNLPPSTYINNVVDSIESIIKDIESSKRLLNEPVFKRKVLEPIFYSLSVFDSSSLETFSLLTEKLSTHKTRLDHILYSLSILDSLKVNLEETISLQKELDTINKECESLLDQKKEALKTLKFCPTCGNKV